MNFIKATRARVVAIALAIGATLAWIASFKIPTERIQFISYAISKLWPEILVILVLVYLTTSFRYWRDKAKSWWMYTGGLNEATDGLVRKIMIGSTILSICIVLLWAPKVYMQAAEALDRRLRMYGYVFSGNYINYLHESASKELAKGSPSTAARYLGSASTWPATSDSVKARYAGYSTIANSRDALASQFYDTFRKNDQPITNVTGTAYVAGAFVLDRSNRLYADAAKSRLHRLRQFKQSASEFFASCGASAMRQDHDRVDNEACKHLVAQTLVVDASTCKQAARAYCETYSLSAATIGARSQHFASFFDRSTGLADLDRVVNSKLPEWRPGYYAED